MRVGMRARVLTHTRMHIRTSPLYVRSLCMCVWMGLGRVRASCRLFQSARRALRRGTRGAHEKRPEQGSPA